MLQSFVPERCFIRDRRVIDMRIDFRADGLQHGPPMLPADHGFRQI
jgi:hypothetical protein